MKFITCDCDCEMWDESGADVDEIPDCEFGGIHYFDNKVEAARKWRELKAFYKVLPGHHFPVPYYWAVHYKGRHIVNIV